MGMTSSPWTLSQVVHLVSQDLSIAGNRKGLAGERSGLFMEQVRIIKEMREGDRKRGRTGELIRPRYCVWENVPGAFSSNKGKDFQAVLTEFVRVSEPDAPEVPMPEKGKWPKSGWLYDELGGWSVAWRVHDAQFWGVPQRRKRIALVADFNGLTAPEILFDPQYRRETERAESNETETDSGDGSGPEVQAQCESVSRDSEPSGTQGEGTAEGTEGSIGGAGEGEQRDARDSGRSETGDGRCGNLAAGAISFQERAGKPGGAREFLSRVSEREHCQRLTTSPSCKNPWDPQSARVYGDDSTWHSLNANENGGQSRDAVFTVAFMGGQGSKAGGLGYQEELSPSLKSVPSGGNTVPDIVRAVHQNASGEVRESDVSCTVGTNQNASGRNTPLVRSVDCRNGCETEELNGTLQAKPNGGYSLNTGGRASNEE